MIIFDYNACQSHFIKMHQYFLWVDHHSCAFYTTHKIRKVDNITHLGLAVQPTPLINHNAKRYFVNCNGVPIDIACQVVEFEVHSFG